MFGRLHDPQTTKKNSQQSQTSYANLNKIKNTQANSYAQKYKVTKQPSLNQKLIAITPTLELIKNQYFLYQGYVKQNHKHGEGILMTRNGLVVIGIWKNDVLHGRAIIFTPFGGKIFANFTEGKLNGWIIATHGEKLIICVLFYENKIDGEKLTYEETEKLWIASKYTEEGKLISISHVEKGNRKELPSFLNSEDLEVLYEQHIIGNKKYLREMIIIQEQSINSKTSYIGFMDQEIKPYGLGVIYSKDELYYGHFEEGSLEYYGRIIFSNGEIYHGELANGIFFGKGIYYRPNYNITSIVNNNQGEQVIQIEHKGYLLIDIQPSIGNWTDNCLLGFKEKIIQNLSENIQKYFFRSFVQPETSSDHQKSDKESVNSDEQDFGHSEDMEQKNAFSPNFIPDKPLTPIQKQKWINLPKKKATNETSQLEELALGRKISIDKKEAKQMKLDHPFELVRTNTNKSYKSNQNKDFQSIRIKQNSQKEESQTHGKKNPNNLDTNGQLFSKKDKESNSLQIQQLTFRKRRPTNESRDSKGSKVSKHSKVSKNSPKSHRSKGSKIDIDSNEMSAGSRQQPSPFQLNRSPTRKKSDVAESSQNSSDGWNKLGNLLQKSRKRKKIFD